VERLVKKHATQLKIRVKMWRQMFMFKKIKMDLRIFTMFTTLGVGSPQALEQKIHG
jgi:hypothetical protein